MSKNFKEELDDGRIEIIHGDGRNGYKDAAPYDIIHVGAAAAKVPKALLDQLAVGGMMMIPVGSEHGSQYVNLYTKGKDGKINSKQVLGVRYVPLTSQEHQLGRCY